MLALGSPKPHKRPTRAKRAGAQRASALCIESRSGVFFFPTDRRSVGFNNRALHSTALGLKMGWSPLH